VADLTGAGPIAELLSKIFGWAVSPSGFALMKLEWQLKFLRVGMDIAIEKHDPIRADLVLDAYRKLMREYHAN
jgi:hypothetical protein